MINKEIIRTVKFAAISVSAGAIELGSFALLNEILHWDYWLSYLIGLVLSVLWNYTINRKYTFKSSTDIKKSMLLVFAFYLVFTPASTLLEKVLTDLGWNEYLVTLINMVLNLILEYIYDRYVVYRDSVDTNAIAEKEKQKESV